MHRGNLGRMMLLDSALDSGRWDVGFVGLPVDDGFQVAESQDLGSLVAAAGAVRMVAGLDDVGGERFGAMLDFGSVGCDIDV